MKIFVLEDDPNRIERLRQELIGHDLTVATSVEEARELWGAGEFDLAFLDHDLGGKTFVRSEEENTGYRFLSEKLEGMREMVVVIHTLNPIGAINMFNLAQGKAGRTLRIPYGEPLFQTIPPLLAVLEEVGSEV